MDGIRKLASKVTDAVFNTPLLKYINFRDKTIQIKKAEEQSPQQTPSPEQQMMEDDKPISMGGEPDSVLDFEEKQRDKHTSEKPDIVIELKESIQKQADEMNDGQSDAMFQYTVELLKDGKQIDEAIELAKSNFSGDPINPEVSVGSKTGSIKKVIGDYSIVEIDGTIRCLRKGEFNVQ